MAVYSFTGQGHWYTIGLILYAVRGPWGDAALRSKLSCSSDGEVVIHCGGVDPDELGEGAGLDELADVEEGQQVQGVEEEQQAQAVHDDQDEGADP